MEYKFRSIENFLKDLSAKIPTPGGGSVAALAAAFAAGLISMVAQYTKGKDAKEKRLVKEVAKKAKFLSTRFLHLADADVDAYNHVSYSNKESHKAYQIAMKKATKIPLGVAIYCSEALHLAEKFSRFASKYLMSDLVIAKKLLKTALSASLINVKINLRNIDDKYFISATKKRIANIQR